MVAETEEGLQTLMDGLNDVSQEYGMKINVKKTKVMRISRHFGGNLNIILNEDRIEQVTKFYYLGTLIPDNGSCSTKIRSRIAMAKTAFIIRKELFTRGMSQKVKNRSSKQLFGVSP